MNDEMIIGTREEQRPDVMELENESNCDKVPETIVKELQANLFPPVSKKLNFFSNFLFKTITNQDQNENDEKLKNSYPNRDLYTINKEYTFTPQLPRWPTECQVLDERIGHIYYNPTDPEPYYRPTGEEAQPPPAGDECGTVVYKYNPISAVNYFTRSSIGGGCYIQSPTIQYDIEDEDTLEFESRFECGNLEKAIRITSSYYELHLRSDFYTNRHMQWFYFRITNMKKNFLYRFSIVNFTKDGSLFGEGMRPLMYSKKDAQLHSIGWRRFGNNITYYSNDNVGPDDPDAPMTYTLTFTTEFPHDNDEVYFANCYPYTYSDLEEYLEQLANHPIKSRFTTIRLLCKSLAGNNVHYVTITTPQQADQCKRKPAVVITARVHPGETPSSWIMKGFLDYLTSDCLIAKELRDRFIFKLIPMLNPDGVIVGNNRCSLTGKDLNRQYKSVIREQYPSVCYTKMLIRRLLDECGVALYCDLHAHSRQHNIFIYGCEKHSKNGVNNEIKLQEQVFPLMLHKNADDKFCFESCKFKVQKSKEGTGRVVMWMLGITNSYTMEASFAGSTLGSRNLTHFNLYDFEQMAKTFCQTLLDLYDDTPRKEKLRSKILHKLIQYGSNAYEPTNIELTDNSSDEGGISSSSSNEVGHDYDDHLITAPPPTPIINQKPTKKLKLKKKKPMKSPDVIRKPLPICKATLGLNFLSISNPYIIDSSDTDNNVDDLDQNYKKHKLKRRKSKKLIKSKKRQQSNDFQNTRKNIAVCELLPTEEINNEIAIKRSRTSQQLKSDRKNIVTQQLSQVQAKLLSLKNKFWFGARSDSNSETNIPLSTNLKKSMNKKNKSKKYKKLAKSSKTREETTKTGLKRQTAIDVDEDLKIKKTTSLPTIKQLNIKNKQLNNCGSLVKSFLNCSINNDSNENEPTNCLLKKRKKQQQKDQKF